MLNIEVKISDSEYNDGYLKGYLEALDDVICEQDFNEKIYTCDIEECNVCNSCDTGRIVIMLKERIKQRFENRD